jgi:F-type H+-transporting ATPase subunit b
MLIDWFTVGAQALNFLILVWLMKRFLYKPILHAIDAREKRIATELADADAKKAETQKERDEFKRKNEEFDQQRAALWSKATDEAKAERQRLLDQARNESDGLRAKRQDALRSEYQSLSEEITRRTREEVLAIARKVLTDLAGTSLEERMVDVFVRRLRGLNSEEMERLVSALEASPNPVLVRTTFDLPPAQRASIEGAVKETLGTETQVQFDTVPDLVSGIELTANGQKVAWSIADYLASLGKAVDEFLKQQPKPEAKAEPKPDEPKPEPEREPKQDIKPEQRTNEHGT